MSISTSVNRAYIDNFIYFFGGTWISTQGLMLTRQAPYHLSHSSILSFCFSYFSDRVSCVCLEPDLDCDPPTYTSLLAGITCVCHHAHLLVEMGLSLSFCPHWPLSVILPISASLVAGIIGVYHHA
jgi:hypothetical protein